MRRLVYAVLFVGMVLGLINLTLTNSLATEGESLKSISRQKTIREQEVSRLNQATMEAQSLERIKKRANELGFATLATHTRLKIEMLASSRQ